LKTDQWNEFERFKARLVAHGFTQIFGIDYREMFVPVVKFTSLQVMFAVTAYYGLTIYHMDIVTAFLNTELDKEICVARPLGLPLKLGAHGDEMVLHLQKSLYGLKQASQQWYCLIDSIFKSLGFTRLQSNHSIYLCRRDIFVVIVLYVDDLQGATNNKASWDSVKLRLSAHLKMKDLRVVLYCLGLEIEPDLVAGTVQISQRKYFESILKQLGMADCRPVSTPFSVGTKLTKEMLPKTDEERKVMASKDYLGPLGCVMYGMLGTCGDLAFAVGVGSWFSSNPGIKHWNTLIHLLRYIKGTLDFGITYRRAPGRSTAPISM
jgi:hypothetical protein